MKQRLFFVVLLLAILTFPLLAGLLLGQARLVVTPAAASQVDETLAQMARDGRFSGSVLIAQDGEVLLSNGYGLADRVRGIPITPQTRFHLGSLSKQFTALGILILESRGKLSVQDPICNFVANCPPEWRGVTIHHLLTHTSGLSSDQSSTLYGEIMSTQSGLAAPAEQAKYLGFTIRWFLDSQPGEQFAYSNFGYILLAYIIEQVSGQSYIDYLNQAIFTPLNMHDTGYQDGSSGVAWAYLDKDTLAGEQFGSYPVTDGADNLYSTGQDLLLWDQALYTDRLLPRDQLEPMYTPFVRESDLPGFGSGYGWFVSKLLGRPVRMGTGGGPAFVTIYFRLPADGLTLIVLTNQADSDPIGTMTALVLAIAGKLFLSDLVLTLTAIAFILLLAVLLAAQSDRRIKATRVIGVLWLLLAVPLALVFSRYLAEGRGLWTLLPLGLVLLTVLVKTLVDLLLRIDLGSHGITRLAYLTLNCLALFSLVWLAFRIHPSWAIPVLIALGILLVSLFFMYRNRISARKQHAGGSNGSPGYGRASPSTTSGAPPPPRCCFRATRWAH